MAIEAVDEKLAIKCELAEWPLDFESLYWTCEAQAFKASIVNGNENSSKNSNSGVDHDDSDDEKDEEGGVAGAEHQGGRLALPIFRFEGCCQN